MAALFAAVCCTQAAAQPFTKENFPEGSYMLGNTTDPNAAIAQLLPNVTAQDIIQFHQQHIAGNHNRVWIIIGDKKLTNLDALSRYGKVIELEKEDVYK